MGNTGNVSMVASYIGNTSSYCSNTGNVSNVGNTGNVVANTGNVSSVGNTSNLSNTGNVVILVI